MTDPLYLTEHEIGRRILGPSKARDWGIIARILEGQGLPPVNPVIGMRNWEAVVAWFRKYERIDSISPGKHSGEEKPWQGKRRTRRDTKGVVVPEDMTNIIGWPDRT